MPKSSHDRTEALGRVCDTILKGIDQTLDWATPEVMLDGDRREFKRSLRNSRREFSRLKRAATRPMCVAVFGPSQVGKSYLINSLSRREGRSIAVRFGDQEFDFLSELNPEGEGTEATGLVSRFTTKVTESPEGFPVEVRLHSLSDIIKIIANTYFLDFNVAVEASCTVSEEEISEEIESARKSRGAEGRGELDEDGVLDIKEYVEERFHGRRTEEMLRTTGFWDDFASMASQIGTLETERLVEIIWGRNPRLTELFRLVRDALQKVEFSQIAHCEIGALKPRNKSIINIDSLDQLGMTETETVRVRLQSGKVRELGRAEMTAIISELILTLSEKPADYFDHADLLDFPGYRPRFELQPAKMQEYLERPDAFRELFRRGKVDYLFDSYRREQEITALLLCLSKGNQDVHAIPPLVDRWVKETHGATPKLRQHKDVALFVVKTKFDLYFPDSEGADADSGEAWKKAIGSEHIEFLGRAGDWPTTWTPERPFTNLFWIRNPAMKNYGLLDYDKETNREIGLRDPDRVDAFRRAYLAEPTVQSHIADPLAAFDAALTLEDGGVSYLAEKLSPVCNPNIKFSQIETRLSASADRLLTRLKEHHVSDDREEETKKRNDAAQNAVNLIITFAESERFGHLIDMMQVDRMVMKRALAQVKRSGKSGQKFAPRRSAAGSRAAINSLIGRSDVSRVAETPEDRSQVGARSALHVWSREALAQVEKPLHHIGVDPAPDVFRNLIQEILQAAERVKLESHIAKRIRDLTSDTFSDEVFLDLQSTISSEEINEFVWTLGYRSVPPEERPRLGGAEGEPIFKDRMVSSEDIDIDFENDGHINTTVASWCVAYLDLVEMNISGPSGGPANPESNKKLGSIISEIATAMESAS